MRNGYRLRKAYLKFDDEDFDRAYLATSHESVRSVLDGISLDRPSSVVSQMRIRDMARFLPVVLRAIL